MNDLKKQKKDLIYQIKKLRKEHSKLCLSKFLKGDIKKYYWFLSLKNGKVVRRPINDFLMSKTDSEFVFYDKKKKDINGNLYDAYYILENKNTIK